jgi:hypothetical protein
MTTALFFYRGLQVNLAVRVSWVYPINTPTDLSKKLKKKYDFDTLILKGMSFLIKQKMTLLDNI